MLLLLLLYVEGTWGSVTNFHLVLRQEFAPSDEELEAYRKGEEWDPQLAEQRRRLKVSLDVYVHVYFTEDPFRHAPIYMNLMACLNEDPSYPFKHCSIHINIRAAAAQS